VYIDRNSLSSAHIQKTREISALLTHSGEDIKLLSVRTTQLQTRYIVWHKSLISESPYFKYHAEGQLFSISLRYCLVFLLITYLQLNSWHLKFITNSRTHSDLMSTVCVK